MMIRNRLLLSALLSFGVMAPASVALAHPGHEEEKPVDKSVAVARAKAIVKTMVDRQILDAGWLGLNPISADLGAGADGLEWEVVFRNDKAKDPAKRSLYVMLSPGGTYLAANHTGN